MNGLDTETVVMVWTLALVAGGIIGGFLVAVLWQMFGDLATAATRAVLGFLERAFRDIVAGLLNGVEWLVYGAVTG